MRDPNYSSLFQKFQKESSDRFTILLYGTRPIRYTCILFQYKEPVKTFREKVSLSVFFIPGIFHLSRDVKRIKGFMAKSSWVLSIRKISYDIMVNDDFLSRIHSFVTKARTFLPLQKVLQSISFSGIYRNIMISVT